MKSEALWQIVPYSRGTGIGPDDTFKHFNNIGPKEIDTLPAPSQDFVVVNDWDEPLEELLKRRWRVLKPGGHLILFLPEKHTAPMLAASMETVGSWDLVFSEQGLQIYRKLQKKGIHRVSAREPGPEKTVCLVRYGGFGDMIQASNCLPGLKKQGFHVSVMTTPAGYEILKLDPHIDSFILQDKDQVPNHLLGPYWKWWQTRFDRWVNLSMSVEGQLLVLPSDVRAGWAPEAIHAMCNHNYIDLTCKIAGVPPRADQRFYPSEEETKQAKATLKPLKGKTVIMWSLSGSSMHKATPFTDAVIARTLKTYPEAHFILVGDEACQILECGWENEPRVWCRSNQYSIRETLTLAHHVDVVIGPETGVLNAVGMEPVHKIILLSHSSEENLTRHWKNTTVLAPTSPCYPCHKLHYGWGTCPTEDVMLYGETQPIVACVASLGPDILYKALRDVLMEKAA